MPSGVVPAPPDAPPRFPVRAALIYAVAELTAVGGVSDVPILLTKVGYQG